MMKIEKANKSSSAGTTAEQRTDVDDKHVSQPIAKPIVSGCRARPILFSTPMVQAILEGRKTQTRRGVKFPKDFVGGNAIFDNQPFGLKYESTDFLGCLKRLFPKWQIGDVLWVRETWTLSELNIKYRADGEFNQEDYELGVVNKWKPSIFMPREAARIFLKVTNIRVERLQDITEEDAVNEGISFNSNSIQSGYGVSGSTVHVSAISAFKALWQKINGVESWDENPWLWVIEFETCERPLDSH